MAALLGHKLGAHGETLAIIALVTSVVSGTTAYFAARVAEFRLRKDNEKSVRRVEWT